MLLLILPEADSEWLEMSLMYLCTFNICVTIPQQKWRLELYPNTGEEENIIK